MILNWSALTNKQQKIAVGVVLLATVQIVVLGGFMIKGSSGSSGGSSKDLEELQLKLSEAKDVILRKAAVESELEGSIEKLEDMSVFAPAVFDRYAWAYEYVSRRSSLAGVVIDGLQEEISMEMKDGADSSSVPYEVSILTRCGFNELVRFLWYLEAGNPLIMITDLTIDKLPDDPERHSVRIVVQWPPAFRIERADG